MTPRRPTPGERDEARERHEASLPNGDWYSVTQLARRWHVSPNTVRAIPVSELPYKTFGSSRRRYRGDWVRAYEEPSLPEIAA